MLKIKLPAVTKNQTTFATEKGRSVKGAHNNAKNGGYVKRSTSFPVTAFRSSN